MDETNQSERRSLAGMGFGREKDVRVVLCVLALLVLSSCKKAVPVDQSRRADTEPNASDRRPDENPRDAAVARQLCDLCANRNAIVDWEKQLPSPEHRARLWPVPVFTAQIEHIFGVLEHRPCLFFARPYDIMRLGANYMLVADVVPYVFDSERSFFFRLQLRLPTVIADPILQSAGGSGVYAVVATIRSVGKPPWVRIYPEEMTYDPNDSMTGFVGAEGNPDVFILRGDCCDMVLATDDPSPPAYKRFRKVFDSEPNIPR